MIFEGDIVSIGDLMYQVAFRYAEWKLDIVIPKVYCNPCFYSHADTCEVIGNIHDNEYLLGEREIKWETN